MNYILGVPLGLAGFYLAVTLLERDWKWWKS